MSTTRSRPAAKVLIGFLEMPPKRETDRVEEYRYCVRAIYQEFWRLVLRYVNVWRRGFAVKFPGLGKEVVLVPRIGVVLADIPEQRRLAATNGQWSVTCNVRFGEKKTGEVDVDEEEEEVEEAPPEPGADVMIRAMPWRERDAQRPTEVCYCRCTDPVGVHSLQS